MLLPNPYLQLSARSERLCILWGDFGENPLSHPLHQDTKAQVTTVAIAISLTHQGFGAIVLAFDKAITQANGQEVKEGQNFRAPVAKGRQSFAQFGRSI